MKKILIAVAIVLGAINAGAETTKESQKDTTIVTSVNVKFSVETYETKEGTFKESYFVLIDGEWYHTNKTSYNKYMTIKRLGGTPNIFFVKPKESKVKVTPRVIVL